MKFLKSFIEMTGRTVLAVKESRTLDKPINWDTSTLFTLILFTDDTCILYREDLGYDPIFGVVDNTDVSLNDKVRLELGLPCE